MTGVFRTIILALLFWFGFKYIKYIIQKLSGADTNDNSFSKNPHRPNVDKDAAQSQPNFEGGEYIEYEEIKD